MGSTIQKRLVLALSAQEMLGDGFEGLNLDDAIIVTDVKGALFPFDGEDQKNFLPEVRDRFVGCIERKVPLYIRCGKQTTTDCVQIFPKASKQVVAHVIDSKHTTSEMDSTGVDTKTQLEVHSDAMTVKRAIENLTTYACAKCEPIPLYQGRVPVYSTE